MFMITAKNAFLFFLSGGRPNNRLRRQDYEEHAQKNKNRYKLFTKKEESNLFDGSILLGGVSVIIQINIL